jgi:2-methylisocitrate lyase-like PEP mutase family enzyme
MSDKTPILSFRNLHEQPELFIIPNPWDVGSAKILASMGFKALATTSAGYAHSRGLEDGAVSFGDMLNHCREIVAATPLPVSADLEKGFGDEPETAAETVRQAAVIGLAGASIEDFTGDADSPIFDFDLAVERIAAAAEAARSLETDFVLTARSENFLYGRPDLDDTIKRLQAFEAAGADVLYAPGLREISQVRAVCEAVSKPVNVIMGLPGVVFTVADLNAAGVKRISLGSSLARLAYGSLIRAATEMRDSGSFSFAGDAAGFAEIEKHF